jgi:methionyl-tRNA formyltransferase
MAGDAETGVAIMQMEAGLDTGPVRLMRAVPIGAEATTAEVHDALSALGAAMAVEVLEDLAAFPPVAQPAEGVTYAAKIDKAEARVDWTRPAVAVDRLIRGLSPFPGAWCVADGERLKLLRSRVVPGDGAPGQVLGGLVVACGDGAVEITEAQREGKKAASAAEVLRGFDLPPVLD